MNHKPGSLEESAQRVMLGEYRDLGYESDKELSGPSKLKNVIDDIEGKIFDIFESDVYSDADKKKAWSAITDIIGDIKKTHQLTNEETLDEAAEIPKGMQTWLNRYMTNESGKPDTFYVPKSDYIITIEPKGRKELTVNRLIIPIDGTRDAAGNRSKVTVMVAGDRDPKISDERDNHYFDMDDWGDLFYDIAKVYKKQLIWGG